MNHVTIKQKARSQIIVPRIRCLQYSIPFIKPLHKKKRKKKVKLSN